MPERAAAEAAPAGPPASHLAAGVTARRMWTLFEPVHIISYFAAEPRQAFEQVAVRGLWRADSARRLAGRGLARPDGTATAAGTALYQDIENATDQAAARPWSRLPGARAVELAELLRPIARACAAALPFPHRFPHPAGASDLAAC